MKIIEYCKEHDLKCDNAPFELKVKFGKKTSNSLFCCKSGADIFLDNYIKYANKTNTI